LFSIKKDKVSNKNLATLIDRAFFQQIQLSIQEFYLNNGEVVEFQYNTADEKIYSAKITYVEIRSFEEILYILSMQDITEQVLSRKNLEIAYEKEINLNKMKTTFLENVSHEIRTPFNAIVGYSDIIDESIKENDYGAVVDMVSSFKDVLGRVLKLFTNIVEVFHISSGELELDYVSLNINQVLKSVYNKRIDEAKEKSVEFILDVDAHDLIIETDWIKFETIINSLVDNAIKYTEKGSIKISSCPEANIVKIVITDTGIGIKTDNISRLYEPFVQEEDSSYLRNYEGAGLGLTIAYKLTQILGGEFDLKSRENRGTQITLKFPLIINANNIKKLNKI
jgi:signal transduction histidine kinase